MFIIMQGRSRFSMLKKNLMTLTISAFSRKMSFWKYHVENVSLVA